MKFFLPFFLLVSFSSCVNKDGGYHLQPAVMQKILADINFAEAYSQTIKDNLHGRIGKNSDSLAVYYKDIFNHYNITPEQFTESLDWYKNHPEQVDTILNNIAQIVTSLLAKPLDNRKLKIPKIRIPYYEKPQYTPDVLPNQYLEYFDTKDSLANPV